MVHTRTKPQGAARTYGVLVGHILSGRESGGASPHYQILVEAAGRYRIAVNVRSVDGSDVLTLFDSAFTQPTRADLPVRAASPAGFTALSTGPEGDGLDYIRDGLVALDRMQPAAPKGGPGALGPLLDAQVAAAVADAGSVVLVFGEFFQDPEADQTFGFSPERGVHDVHMMQGNAGSAGSFADDNRVRGDGALFLRATNGTTGALFVRFATQATDTDPQTGAPLT